MVMSTDIATIQRNGPGAVARHQDVDMTMIRDLGHSIKSLLGWEGSDPDLMVFSAFCNKRGLDPLSKQIYAIFRQEGYGENARKKMAIQTSIDGFRSLAVRTGQYGGQTMPEWCGADGVWRDVWVFEDPPLAARIGVMRKDTPGVVYWGVAVYAEYVQTEYVKVWENGQSRYVNGPDGQRQTRPNAMWRKMPSNQLLKCAESQALRRGFPDDLGGIYTDDEMGQADRAGSPSDIDGEAVEVAHAPQGPKTGPQNPDTTRTTPTGVQGPSRPAQARSGQTSTQAQPTGKPGPATQEAMGRADAEANRQNAEATNELRRRYAMLREALQSVGKRVAAPGNGMTAAQLQGGIAGMEKALGKTWQQVEKEIAKPAPAKAPAEEVTAESIEAEMQRQAAIAKAKEVSDDETVEGEFVAEDEQPDDDDGGDD